MMRTFPNDSERSAGSAACAWWWLCCRKCGRAAKADASSRSVPGGACPTRKYDATEAAESIADAVSRSAAVREDGGGAVGGVSCQTGEGSGESDLVWGVCCGMAEAVSV